jgi:hypothetical protein
LNSALKEPSNAPFNLVKFAVKARFRQRMGAFAADGSEVAERRTETRWLPSRNGMAEVINLRTVRKKAKRQERDQTAQTNRLTFGQPKHLRELEAAQQAKASRDLDRRRIEKGDRR